MQLFDEARVQIAISRDNGMKRLGAAILICLSTAILAAAQGNPRASAPAIDDVYLARDDGNGKAGETAAEFRTTDIPIHCVVVLESPAKVTVKMNFVAVRVTGVKPETKVVSATYTTSERQNRVNFTGTPEGTWTPGRYRVDLFLDGKAAQSVEFDIKVSTTNVAAASYLKPPDPPKPKPQPKKKP
jgi:hypothetical protein